MSQIFINPATGDVWNYGDRFSWPNLAVTLEKMAKHGGDEFYSGETMELMLQDLASVGSIITPEDFLQHTYSLSHRISSGKRHCILLIGSLGKNLFPSTLAIN